MIERKELLEKLLRLRCRIEDWTHVYGWKNMDNWVERKTANDEVIYKKTDWEYVDDTYNLMINDTDFYPHTKCFKKMNVMWKKYK